MLVDCSLTVFATSMFTHSNTTTYLILHLSQSESAKQHPKHLTNSTDSWRELPNATAILVSLEIETCHVSESGT